MFQLGKLNELAARKKILTLLNIDPGVELEASSAADYKTENTSSLILQSLLIHNSMEMPNAAVYTRIDAEKHNYEIIFGFVTVVGLFFISLLLMIGILLVEIKTYRIVSFKFKIAFIIIFPFIPKMFLFNFVGFLFYTAMGFDQIDVYYSVQHVSKPKYCLHDVNSIVNSNHSFAISGKSMELGSWLPGPPHKFCLPHRSNAQLADCQG